MFGKNKSTGSIEYIVVGLGNPDRKYENTRHNAGWLAIDRIADKLGCDVNKIKYKSFIGTCTVNGAKVMLMKPTTYMNNSGQAIYEAMNYYKLDIEHVVIVYDDISLEPGKLRIRRKGSDGGHNGIKSIIYLTGEDTFPRIKMGVGKKPHPKYDLADWVLSRFSPDDRKKLGEAADNACECIEMIVGGRIDEAMNRYNS